MKIVKQNQLGLSEAIEILNNGGIIVCPTDTVYGFLADATNKKAVEKIFKIKQRPRSKPLPVFVKDIKMAKTLAKINEKQEKILRSKWPGKYTFILSSLRGVPLSGTTKQSKPCEGGAHTTIALRIPKYKFLNDLLKRVDKPLAQTSVNISGQPPLTKISDIIEKFAMSDIAILIIDGGDLKKSKPSAIIDLIKDNIKILRN